jgi:hypothetical protein
MSRILILTVARTMSIGPGETSLVMKCTCLKTRVIQVPKVVKMMVLERKKLLLEEAMAV